MSITRLGRARQRIAALLDESSFVEIGAKVTLRSTDFNLGQDAAENDGVVTGFGAIDGKPVYIYAQEPEVLSGTVGEMHAKKITNLYKLAINTGTPIIGLLDSAGVRIEESTDALNAFAKIYKKQVQASGAILQISAILGNAGGGAAVSAALSDFVFMESAGAKLFVNAPNTLEANYTAKNDTAGAAFQTQVSGLADAAGDEPQIFSRIRSLFSLLPPNSLETDDYEQTNDDLNRESSVLASSYEPAVIFSEISDSNIYYEVKADYAKDVVTAFIRLDGVTVGAVGTRSALYGSDGKVAKDFESRLSSDGADKAASFIKFCDAYSIPLLTAVNVSGFAATVSEEAKIAKAAARLTAALVCADVPKINLITEKAYGSAYSVFNSKGLGADITFAWENAKIGAMDAKTAAKIIAPDDIAATEKELEDLQNHAASAAKRGYVDAVIAPAQTRKYVCGALELLIAKSPSFKEKKHLAF